MFSYNINDSRQVTLGHDTKDSGHFTENILFSSFALIKIRPRTGAQTIIVILGHEAPTITNTIESNTKILEKKSVST